MTPENVLAYRLRVLNKTKQYYYGDTLLDVGCGDGLDDELMLKYFKRIEGIDINENPAWNEHRRENLILKKADAENLDYPDNSFDTVIEKDVLHHVSDPEKALKEMTRIAKKRIILIEANRYNPLFYIFLTLMWKHNHFRQKRFKELVKSSGLQSEIMHFSARVCPINNSGFIKFFDKLEDLIEKFPPYTPIIEYNLAIITK